MSRLLIATPSKGRPVDFVKNTYSFFKHTAYDYKVFVEPQDYSTYREAGVSVEHIFPLDRNDQGLPYASLAIKRYAEIGNFEYVFRVDDDVTGMNNALEKPDKNLSTDKKRLWHCGHTIDGLLIEDAIILLNEMLLVGAVRLSGRLFFMNFGKEQWLAYNKPLATNYIVRTKLMDVACYAGVYKGFYEDVAVSLNIIAQGFLIVEYGLVSLDYAQVGVNAGGQQTWDRVKESERERIFLSNQFPFLVWKFLPKRQFWNYGPDWRKSLKNFQSYYSKTI